MSHREPAEKPADALDLRPSERLAWATVYAAAVAGTMAAYPAQLSDEGMGPAYRLARHAADRAIRDMRERSR